MTTKVYSVRHNEDELNNARTWCKENSTTLPIQVRKFIEKLSKQEIIILREVKLNG